MGIATFATIGPHVCRLREYFNHAVVRVVPCPTHPWFLFQFAKQSPFVSSWLALSLAAECELPDLNWELTIAVGHVWNKWEFSAADMVTFTHDFDMTHLEHHDLYVLPGVFVSKTVVSHRNCAR